MVYYAASDTINEGIFFFRVYGFKIIPQHDYLDNDHDYFYVGVLGVFMFALY
jgi:hypothetical protein